MMAYFPAFAAMLSFRNLWIVVMRNTLFALGSVVVSIAASLLLFECGLRVFYFRPWSELNLVGNPDHRMTRAFHDNVNEDGIRSPVEAGAFLADNFNVLFLGDSFTYGWRVMMGKTMPAQFERQAQTAGYASMRSINFGWVSSSPYLSERLLREKALKYKPDLVVLTLDMTDIFDDRLYRNIVERKHFFAVGQYLPAITQFVSLINQSLWQSEWLARNAFGVPARHFFIVEHPLEETRPYFDQLMMNVDTIHTYCRDVLGVPFVLFVMPRYFQFDPRLSPSNWEKAQYPLTGPYVLEPFHYFDEVAKQKPYPIISLLGDFKNTKVFPVTFPDDPHLNESGNTVAADAVLKHLSQQGLLLK
jgi:hypothetical protein